MRKFSFFPFLIAILTICAAPARAQDVNVAGTLTYAQGTGGVYNYTLSLSNTGPEGLESLWLGWIVGQFNIVSPASFGNSVGWSASADGASIKYAGSVNTAIAAGATATFTFSSTSTPAQFAAGTAGPSVVYGTNASPFAIENTTLHSEEFTPTVASPVITAQPQSQTVLTNATVMFSVIASNAISYQWQSNMVDLPGATNDSLTLSNVVTNDSATYRVVVSNATDSVTSSDAVLVVLTVATPVITTQPQSQTVLTNATVMFSVIASNAISYQWQSNMVDLPGATNDSLTLSNVVTNDSATYRVVVSNATDSVISSNAVLVVLTALIPVILTQPQSTNAVTNTTVAFSATASNAATFQWQSNMVAIGGATNDSLILSNVMLNDSAIYRVVVSNGSAAVISSNAVLLVGFPPAFTIQPASADVLAGTPLTLQAQADGSPPPEYQWLSNNAVIAGQTNLSLSLGAATTQIAATYSVTVSNLFGAQTSSNAVVTVEPLATTTREKLVVTVNPAGAGTVTPNDNNKNLIVTHIYTVKAVPARGQAFSHWSGIADSEDSSLTFAMPLLTNATLTANFIPSPFASNGVAGTYAGLFWDTNYPANSTSGYFTATVNASGIIGGQVKIAGATASFASTLRADGSAYVPIKRHNQATLFLDLNVDLSGTQTLLGTVTDEDNSFSSSLTAYRAGFSAANKTTAFNGYYTWEMPGDTSNGPGGDSYGAATVAATGAARLGLFLSDNTSASASGSISTNGVMPVYVSLYSGKGAFLAWLMFTNSATTLSTNDALWFKSAPSGIYTVGFTLTNAAILMGAYTPEPTGENALDASAVSVELSGADLFGTNVEIIDLNPAGAGATSTNHLTINLIDKAGLFTGSFKDPTSGKSTRLSGAILRQLPAGFGYFIGGTESGPVVIGPR